MSRPRPPTTGTTRTDRATGAPIGKPDSLAASESAARVIAPSPLAGEGNSAVQQQKWVRGRGRNPSLGRNYHLDPTQLSPSQIGKEREARLIVLHVACPQVGALTDAVTPRARIEPLSHQNQNSDYRDNTEQQFQTRIHWRAVDLFLLALARFPRPALAFFGFPVRCCGPASSHDSGTNSMSEGACDLLESLPMNPISRVRPNAHISLNSAAAMQSRHEAAAKVAECIAVYAEIEFLLALALALLLGVDAKAGLAMYTDVESRSAQLRMLNGAARITLPADHLDVFACVIQIARSAMKERDKMAHWCWGWSMDFPHDLLLAEPTQRLRDHAKSLNSQFDELKKDHIFLLTVGDLTRVAQRFRVAQDLLLKFCGTIWPNSYSSPESRAAWLLQLSSEPPIHQVLFRLRERRKNNQEAQQSSPPQE